MSRWMRCFWDLKETNQGPWEETYIWESLGSTDETQISARSTELWLSWPCRRVSWSWCFNMKVQKDRKREGGGRQPRCRQRSKVQVLMCSRYDQGLASRPLPASDSRQRCDTGVDSAHRLDSRSTQCLAQGSRRYSEATGSHQRCYSMEAAQFVL